MGPGQFHGAADDQMPNGVEEQELPERWSARRKMEIVLRLLRGEDLGQLSRESRVAPQVIEEWRQAAPAGAEAGLKKRSGEGLETELQRTRAKLGETLRKLELAERLLEKRGFGDELKKLRRSEGG